MDFVEYLLIVKDKIKRYQFWVLFALFAFVYLAISLGKNYLFKSAALDLGVFNQAMFGLANFQSPKMTLIDHAMGKSYFSDHFAPIMYLYIPFYKIFGVNALLYIQIGAILLGALGIKKLSDNLYNNTEKSFLSVLYYFLTWGLYSALWFDFHNIVVGACLLPWLFYYNQKQKVVPFLLMYLALLIVKETVSLWLAFIMIGLLFINRSERKFYQRIEFYLILVSFGYFLMVVSVVMPSLAQSEGNWQLGRYDYLGGNLGEILKTLISNPFHSFLLLFGRTGVDGVFNLEIAKIKFWMVFIFAGGFLFIYKPKLLIMLVPILGQKMLANDAAFWGPHNQYSIEFVPIFSYLFLLISIDKLGRTKQWFVILLSFLTTAFVISDKYKHWMEDKSASHSEVEYHVDTSLTENVHWNDGSIFDVYTGLSIIPKGVAVSATSTLVPHIANREKIYMFPEILDAEYIAIHNTNNTYPLNKFEYQQKIIQIFNDEAYELIYNKGNLIIYKKKD